MDVTREEIESDSEVAALVKEIEESLIAEDLLENPDDEDDELEYDIVDEDDDEDVFSRMQRRTRGQWDDEAD